MDTQISPLRRARLSQGKTLNEVGSAVGIDSGNLSRIEKMRQVAGLELAARLADHLGISELEILYPTRFLRSSNVSPE